MFPLLLVSLVACPPIPTLQDGFESTLTETGGCADVEVFAVDAADEVLLSARVDGLVAAARTAGAPTTTTFTLPDDELELMVELGYAISDAICDDVIEGDGPRVDNVYRPTAGTATFTITPGEGEAATATLVLDDVQLEDEETGGTVALPRFEIADVAVGWLPG